MNGTSRLPSQILSSTDRCGARLSSCATMAMPSCCAFKSSPSPRCAGRGSGDPVASGQQTAELVASYFEGKPLPKHVVLDVHTINKGNVDQWAGACIY